MKQLRQLPWELVKYLKVGVPSLLSRERRVRPLPSPSPFAWPAVEWVWRLGEVLGEPAPRSPAKHRPQQREAGAWLRSYHRRPQGWPWESCVHSPPQALGRLFPAWCRQGCSSLGRLSGMETNNLESVEIRANKRQKMGTDVSPGAAVLLGPSSLHKRPSEPAAAGLGPPVSLGQASLPTSDTLPFCLFLPDLHGKRHEPTGRCWEWIPSLLAVRASCRRPPSCRELAWLWNMGIARGSRNPAPGLGSSLLAGAQICHS